MSRRALRAYRYVCLKGGGWAKVLNSRHHERQNATYLFGLVLCVAIFVFDWRAEPLGPAVTPQAGRQAGAVVLGDCQNLAIVLALFTAGGYNVFMAFQLYRAKVDDLKAICKFTDWWLAGRGKAKGVTGAVNDYFISPSQHLKYIDRYNTVIVKDGDEIICWAVLQPSSTLIHLLVAEPYRKLGVGQRVMKFLSPKFVRSKSNQSSGNPIGFYEKLGYRLVERKKSRSRFDIDIIRPTRKSIIDILIFDGGL